MPRENLGSHPSRMLDKLQRVGGCLINPKNGCWFQRRGAETQSNAEKKWSNVKNGNTRIFLTEWIFTHRVSMVWGCIKEDNFQKTQNKLFSLRLCVSALKKERSQLPNLGLTVHKSICGLQHLLHVSTFLVLSVACTAMFWNRTEYVALFYTFYTSTRPKIMSARICVRQPGGQGRKPAA